MSLDTQAGGKPPGPYPLQFINIEITPLIDGEYAIVMQATLLDEDELEFIGQSLANEHVQTLDQALAIIQQNVGVLAPVRTA
jgi:hypothetical protein